MEAKAPGYRLRPKPRRESERLKDFIALQSCNYSLQYLGFTGPDRVLRIKFKLFSTLNRSRWKLVNNL